MMKIDLNWIDPRTNEEILDAAKRTFFGRHFKVITREEKNRSYTAVTFLSKGEDMQWNSRCCVTSQMVA